MYTQQRDLRSPSIRPANTIEIFDNALPDFLSLYGVAAITRQSALLALSAKNSISASNSVSFKINGQVSGIVNILIPSDTLFSTDLITEAANIVLGHLLTKIEAEGLNCSLAMSTNNEAIEPDFSFAVNYHLDNGQKQNNLKFNFYLNRKVY